MSSKARARFNKLTDQWFQKVSYVAQKHVFQIIRTAAKYGRKNVHVNATVILFHQYLNADGTTPEARQPGMGSP